MSCWQIYIVKLCAVCVNSASCDVYRLSCKVKVIILWYHPCKTWCVLWLILSLISSALSPKERHPRPYIKWSAQTFQRPAIIHNTFGGCAVKIRFVLCSVRMGHLGILGGYDSATSVASPIPCVDQCSRRPSLWEIIMSRLRSSWNLARICHECQEEGFRRRIQR